MSAEPVFFDSNVVLYAFQRSDSKAAIAVDLIEAGGIISVQVLNETANVLRKKSRWPWERIDPVVASVLQAFEVVPLTVEIHQLAMSVARAGNTNIYDANIIAAAQLAGCTTLCSEDLQAGQVFGTVTVVNPFLPA